MLIVPSHFRQLKPTETIRAEDTYVSASDHSIKGKVNKAVGRLVSSYHGKYFFYRRRHVKVKNEFGIMSAKFKKPVIVVKFMYKEKTRHVQLIKFDDRYLTGLEITQPRGRDAEHKRPTYKFKNFLRDRMESPAVLERFE